MKAVAALALSLFFMAPALARDAKAVRAFKNLHPCPATQKASGPCPGYVVDHVAPLACGGPDHPDNMQWQTVADAKAKDKWERKPCQLVKPVTRTKP